MTVPRNRVQSAARGASRGAVAAMSMSGLRQVTASLGLVGKTPPVSVLEKTAPALFHRVPSDRRPALVEAVHWTYGAAGGLVFGTLPRRIRRQPWAGPAYGVLIWAVFQAVLAPALGIHHEHATGNARAAELADHVLYGVVVGASPWPLAD